MFGTKTNSGPATKQPVTTGGKMTSVDNKLNTLQTAMAAEAKASVPAEATGVEPLQNVIGKGTIIEGNVYAEGDLSVEGVVKGDVTTKTKLVAGIDSVIEGNILAQHAEIAGRVQGTVKALGLLVINSSGTILGDVITKDLNVESGSIFNGRLQVGSSVSATPIEIPKVTLSQPAPVAAESVFDSPKPAAAAPKSVASATGDKTADQLAANLAKSSMLH